jgi:hypothetical protein
MGHRLTMAMLKNQRVISFGQLDIRKSHGQKWLAHRFQVSASPTGGITIPVKDSRPDMALNL